MKPIVVGLGLCVGGVIAASSGALQAQAPPSDPAHKVFILTGCLTAGPAETAVFKLTGAAPVGQTRPERSAASPDGKDVYELLSTTGLTEQGVAKADMQTHLGKQVEVTVRPVDVVPGPISSPSPTASTAKMEEVRPPRYTATQIKSVADSCL